MKNIEIFIEQLQKNITFYIGQNQSENFEVIDKGNVNDLWIHACDYSSCHVVCILPDKINKKELYSVVKIGALLCKNNTNKLKQLSSVEMIYTQIKNITKTDIDGCVLTKNVKKIIV
jgi:predicted ribosome quality control (RQC) complex YloA/Tae2 family protein